MILGLGGLDPSTSSTTIDYQFSSVKRERGNKNCELKKKGPTI
jgi:hypothetical protein